MQPTKKFNTRYSQEPLKKLYSVMAIVVICALISVTPSGSTVYRFPAEFEKQQAVWIMWPSSVYELGDRSVSPAMVDVIKSLADHVRVNVMIAEDAEAKSIGQALGAIGYSGSNVHFNIISHQSIWARDVGPIFVVGNNRTLSVVDFGFNNYSRDGDEEHIRTEGQIDVRTAQILGLPVINSTLVSEGGAIESNGQGTLMTSESVVLTRNPEMTRQQIENEYKRVLGIKKVIWLKKGLAEDDEITSGHIDEIARFANPTTILLAQVLPQDKDTNWASRNSYQRLEENNRILRQSTDQNGRPWKIIRIPMPPTLYSKVDTDGKIPVRSYLNYALTNGAVLMPTFWKPGESDRLKAAEEQVKATFTRVFPGRKIIGIDAENINRWGGGIHCVTQHQPAF